LVGEEPQSLRPVAPEAITEKNLGLSPNPTDTRKKESRSGGQEIFFMTVSEKAGGRAKSGLAEGVLERVKHRKNK
jgi:hypothetical protein